MKGHTDGHNASAISSRIQNSNLSFSSVESSKYKMEGNGELLRLKQIFVLNETKSWWTKSN